jgi:hypothetical protein
MLINFALLPSWCLPQRMLWGLLRWRVVVVIVMERHPLPHVRTLQRLSSASIAAHTKDKDKDLQV